MYSRLNIIATTATFSGVFFSFFTNFISSLVCCSCRLIAGSVHLPCFGIRRFFIILRGFVYIRQNLPLLPSYNSNTYQPSYRALFYESGMWETYSYLLFDSGGRYRDSRLNRACPKRISCSMFGPLVFCFTLINTKPL